MNLIHYTCMLLSGSIGIITALIIGYESITDVFLLSFFIIFIYFCIAKYPEISFALFLFAGFFKADPRLEFIQERIDLTILFGMICIVGILYGILIKRMRFICFPKMVLAPWLVIILSAVISLTYTSAPVYGTEKVLRLVTITSMALFVPFFLFQNEKSMDRFFFVIIILALFTIVEISRGGLSPKQLWTISPFGSEYLAVGMVEGTAAIIVALYFFMKSQNKYIRGLYFLLTAIFITGLAIGGGRGPIISLACVILFIFAYTVVHIEKDVFFLNRIKRTNLKQMFVLVAIIITAITLFIFIPEIFIVIVRRFEVWFEQGSFIPIDRMQRFEKAFEVITSLPRGLYGLGIGGFSVSYRGLDMREYPHNIILEIGSELGIISLISFVLLIFYSLRSVLNNLKNSHHGAKWQHLVLFGLLLFIFIESLKSGDINDNRLLFCWIGLVYVRDFYRKNNIERLNRISKRQESTNLRNRIPNYQKIGFNHFLVPS